MKLFICEKPSQAKDIAAVLGAKTRTESCFEGQGIAVTWCIGHLLELAPPVHWGLGFCFMMYYFDELKGRFV